MRLFRYAEGSGFTELEPLVTSERGAIQLLTDAHGRAVMVWVHLITTSLQQVYAAYHRPDGSWSSVLAAPHTPQNFVRNIRDFHVADDDSGRVVAAWVEAAPGTPEDSLVTQLIVAELTEEQGWTMSTLVEDAYGVTIGGLAMAPSGHGVLAWEDDADGQLHTSRRDPVAGWSAPEPVLEDTWLVGLTPTANEAGHALVTWTTPRDSQSQLFELFDLWGAWHDNGAWTAISFPSTDAETDGPIGIVAPRPALSAAGTGFVVAVGRFDSELLFFPFASGVASPARMRLDSMERVVRENPEMPRDVEAGFLPAQMAANRDGRALVVWQARWQQDVGLSPGILYATSIGN
jgi:hypothetical protein